jgi:hypothetical protein
MVGSIFLKATVLEMPSGTFVECSAWEEDTFYNGQFLIDRFKNLWHIFV